MFSSKLPMTGCELQASAAISNRFAICACLDQWSHLLFFCSRMATFFRECQRHMQIPILAKLFILLVFVLKVVYPISILFPKWGAGVENDILFQRLTVNLFINFWWLVDSNLGPLVVIGSDRSANWATTTVQWIVYFKHTFLTCI